MRKTTSAVAVNGYPVYSSQYQQPHQAQSAYSIGPTGAGTQHQLSKASVNLTGSSPALHQQHHFDSPIGRFGASKYNNNNHTNNSPYGNGIQSIAINPPSAGRPQRENNSSTSPSYYYSSSTQPTSRRSPSVGAPQKHVAQFRTTTTTLRSNKEAGEDNNHTTAPAHQRPMDFRGSGTLPPPGPNGIGTPAGFSRRHTAAGNHEFPSPPVGAHTPAYPVEHLASFAVGRQFGLVSPADGVRKLKQMERNSAICAVPMLFCLHPDRVAVLEENGSLVEEFPMQLVTDPTAHLSSDPQDLFNNVLLFVVREHGLSSGGLVPTEMHIFQCAAASAQEVAEDLHHYTRGHFHKVRPGRRTSAAGGRMPSAQQYNPAYPSSHPPPTQQSVMRGHYRDDVSAASNSTEYFEMDVNTLNRCFDDIERFVSRIQSAAQAQRELDVQQQRAVKKSSKKGAKLATQNGIMHLRAQMPVYAEFTEIFQKFKLCFNLLAKLRNHIHEPSAPELLHFLFRPLMIILDACQWGLGQQVAQQVFSPLLSSDACELLRAYLESNEMAVWVALGQAWSTPPEEWAGTLPPPYRPVFANGFAPYGYPQQQPMGTRQHFDGPLAQPGPPVHFQPSRFSSAPPPIHRGVSAPVQPAGGGGSVPNGSLYSSANSFVPAVSRERSLDNLELERMNLEKERLEFERRKVLDKERELLEQERRLRQEAERLEQERRQLHRESEKHSIAESDRPDFYRGPGSVHASPRLDRRTGSMQVLHHNGHGTATMAQREREQQREQQHRLPSSNSFHSGSSPQSQHHYNHHQQQQQQAQMDMRQPPNQSPRQKAFLEELTRQGCKIVQVTYDRVAQNPKELTVVRGEYLEVLNDARLWWECRNVHNRTGFVPHTILTVIVVDEDWTEPAPLMDNGGMNQAHERKLTGGGLTGREGGGGPSPGGPAVPAHYKVPMEIRREQKFVPNIMESIGRKKNYRGEVSPRRVQSLGAGAMLDPDSDKVKVQLWLNQKGFSERTREVFSECAAKDLFQLGKAELQHWCGAEASRLNSLLTVAKRRCNYDETNVQKQLEAVLSLRRQRMAAAEDAATEEAASSEPAEKAPTLRGKRKVEKAYSTVITISEGGQRQEEPEEPAASPLVPAAVEEANRRLSEPAEEPPFAHTVHSYH